MKKTLCALCKTDKYDIQIFDSTYSAQNASLDMFCARRPPDRIHYRLVRCQKCGLVRSSPIASFSYIQSGYKKSAVNYIREIPYLQKTYEYYLNKIIPLLPSTDSMLDIGCGNGFFLEVAKKHGFVNVWGVEPAKEIIKKTPEPLKAFIKPHFFKSSFFAKESFDLITCFHTLDHVSDPNQFLTHAHKLLKKNAYAFFITHNVNSLLAKLLKESCPIFDVEHIYLFSPSTLKRIFEQNGFTVINVFSVKNTYPISYLLRMAPVSQNMKESVLSLFAFLRLSSFPLTLPFGNIGIFAKK